MSRADQASNGGGARLLPIEILVRERRAQLPMVCQVFGLSSIRIRRRDAVKVRAHRRRHLSVQAAVLC